MKRFVLFIGVLCTVNAAFGQQGKIDSLKIALKETSTMKEKLSVLESLNNILLGEHSLEASLPYFFEMATIAKELNNTKLETQAYRNISEAYMKQMDSTKSIAFAKKALAINDENNIKIDYLLDFNQLGRVYHHFQYYKKAIETYNKGISKYNRLNDEESLSILSLIYSNSSSSYQKLGNTEESINAILKGIEIAEISNDTKQKCYGMYALAYKYMDLKNYKKAEEYFLKSLTISDSVSFDNYKYMNHHGLGINYSKWGKFDKALYHNSLALDYFRRQGDKLYEFDVLNNTAVLYQRMDEPDSIIKYGKKALKIAKEIKHKLAINGANLTLSRAYIRLNQFNKAEETLLEVAKDTINPKVIDRNSKASIYLSLSEVYEGQKKFGQSLAFHKKYSKLSDSIEKEALDSKLLEVESKYQNEQKEKENLQLKSEKAEQEKLLAYHTKRNWQLGGGLATTVAGLGIFFIAYRKNQKQKKEIELQKNKVELLQKELHHRLKNNLAFIDVFISLAKGKYTDPSYRERLNELQNRIKSMFEIHEQLFRKEDITSVNAKNYISKLAENVKSAYANPNISIEHHIDASAELDSQTSFPMGIIINEFVTNSYKYAFNPDQQGLIKIELNGPPEHYRLKLSDNGKGFSTNFDMNSSNTFGLDSIKLLTQEYNGTFSLSGDQGVTLEVTLPKPATL